ncbi:SNF2-related protein [Haematomicrobium sanguinis]|uniref:DEAD/DEAH box helicase n=1 Tax=Haematomicrobium sanguinis TaxID=479106 RepID=UPI00047DC3E8|nr:SNF2-related protein [Haematomicrobium sanguinis]
MTAMQSWLPRFEDGNFAIDEATLDRGFDYADSGRVTTILWEPAMKMLRGTVQGSGSHRYNTMAKIVPAKDEHGTVEENLWTMAVGICSCPVSTDCKHSVALVTAALREEKIVNALRRDFHLEDIPAEEPEARVDEMWESSLRNLITPPQSESGMTPLALAFDAEPAATRRKFSRGQAHTSVRVRPVSLGARGSWIRSNIGWDNLNYLNYSRKFNEKQLDWLIDFLQGFRRTPQPFNRAHDGWLNLNLYETRAIWDLLRDAQDIGLPLVSLDKNLTVAIEEPATVTLGLTKTDALTAQMAATVDGTAHPASELLTVGQPAHGIMWLDGEPGDAKTLHLSPLARPLTAPVHRFLTETGSLRIPLQDADKFMTQYLPRLQQSVAVTAEDASVELPEYTPPRLSVLARYQENHLVRVHFEWHYPVQDRFTIQPLYAYDGDAYRDSQAESDIVRAIGRPWERVRPLGTPAANGTTQLAPDATLQGFDTVTFTQELLPAWRDIEGVEITIEGEPLDYREAENAPVIQVGTAESDNPKVERDWFDLEITIRLDDELVAFGQVFTELAAGHRKMLLRSGKYFSLDAPEFDELRKLIDEAREMQEINDGKLRVSKFQLGFWDELTGLAVVTEQAERWKRQVAALKQGQSEPAAVPNSINATLRGYQVEGFQWLAYLHDHGLGAILADDMGLGKTLQTLALMQYAKDSARESAGRVATEAPTEPDAEASGATEARGVVVPQPFLVVAPTSVVGNWASEAARFAPGLRVKTITETFKKSRLDAAEVFDEVDVVVTSYALFRIDEAIYGARPWAGLVLDEAQFVKNRKSKAYVAARMLDARFKVAISGTPLENNLMELWSLLSIVAPGLFPNAQRFADFYGRPIEKARNPERLALLRRRAAPLMLRRTKEAVVKELPPKQEQVLEIELNPQHLKVYQTHLQRERQKVLGLLADVEKNRFTIFQSLTRLRQLSLDVSLVDASLTAVSSSKLDALMDQLKDVLAEGHKALIFSQFTGFLGKLRDRLDAAGVEYSYLDGGTRRRSEVIAQFKEGPNQLFLISLKAGGFGLNLTEADYVFILDPWWNPASEAQAVDRTHRIGQDRQVMVYRLVARGTIEDKVMALKAAKSQLFSDVMTGDLDQVRLGGDDLAALFE